jgi:hypothetical protein
MNSASTHQHASGKAGTTRGFVRAVMACALVLGATTGPGAAWAQQRIDRRDDQVIVQERHAEHFRLPAPDPRQGDPRAYDDRRAPPQQAYGGSPYQLQQQQAQQQPQPDRRSSGKLTPDERRDLRRQINEANMDLYPQRR